MHFRTSLLVAAALAAATPARAQDTGLSEIMRVLQRLATQYSILTTRLFVDLTYDSIAIEPGTNDLIVTGRASPPSSPGIGTGAAGSPSTAP